MLYKLCAELITQENDITERNTYEQVFIVDLITKDEKSAVFYDEELKVHVRHPLGVRFTYEIELKDIRLNLCPRVKKSEDFHRKLLYRYDWVRPKVNGWGNIVSIENKEELEQRWGRLRNKILVDYTGKRVENYMNKIDLEFSSDTVVHSAFTQYLHFGLLFLNIPLSHRNDWTRKRTVQFSSYKGEEFEERLTYQSSKDGVMYYGIEGDCLADSSTHVQQYSGSVVRNEGDLFPQKVEISTITEKKQITTKWNFTLYKI